MSANMDTTAGVTSFFSARQDAWHKLGTVTVGSLTAEDALKTAHLADWKVRKTPMFAEVDSVRVPFPGHFGIVRDNPIVEGQVDQLHVAKGRYTVLQNEEMTDLLDAMVDESGAHYETAGAIDGGRKVFVTMKLPKSIQIGGVDPVDTYLAAVTSHDGTIQLTTMATPIRIVCQNTMNLAFENNSGLFRIRHTSGATKAVVQQAREALGFNFRYLEGFERDAERLINTTLTQSSFEEIITREFGASPDAPASAATRAQNKVDSMVKLFADAQTQEGIRDTAWAGLNALTEWADHYSPVHGDDAVRSRKAVLDPSFKNRALALMQAV